MDVWAVEQKTASVLCHGAAGLFNRETCVCVRVGGVCVLASRQHRRRFIFCRPGGGGNIYTYLHLSAVTVLSCVVLMEVTSRWNPTFI